MPRDCIQPFIRSRPMPYFLLRLRLSSRASFSDTYNPLLTHPVCALNTAAPEPAASSYLTRVWRVASFLAARKGVGNTGGYGEPFALFWRCCAHQGVQHCSFLRSNMKLQPARLHFVVLRTNVARRDRHVAGIDAVFVSLSHVFINPVLVSVLSSRTRHQPWRHKSAVPT